MNAGRKKIRIFCKVFNVIPDYFLFFGMCISWVLALSQQNPNSIFLLFWSSRTLSKKIIRVDGAYSLDFALYILGNVYS